MKSLILTVTTLAAVKASAMGGACKADIEKFCKDVQPGRGNVMKCLSQHEAELSAECKAHGQAKAEKMRSARERMQEICGEDFKTHCAEAQGKPDAMRECIKANKDKFSDPCKAKMGKMHGRMHEGMNKRMKQIFDQQKKNEPAEPKE